jgi:DNA-binding NarL/FixJ family response regulator
VAGRYPHSPRVLVASPRGKLIEPGLQDSCPAALTRIAENSGEIRQITSNGPRFDVAVIDLTWDCYPHELAFDGLDALRTIRERDPHVPVIFSVHGDVAERDFVDEADAKVPAPAGFCLKVLGPGMLAEAVRTVAAGSVLKGPEFPWLGSPPGVRQIHEYFSSGPRGLMAAKMAGAIASGHAIDYAAVQKMTGVGHGTAVRPKDYLGPLIAERREHPEDLNMTQGVLFRWCGEHAPYILSWCRRNGVRLAAADRRRGG